MSFCSRSIVKSIDGWMLFSICNQLNSLRRPFPNCANHEKYRIHHPSFHWCEGVRGIVCSSVRGTCSSGQNRCKFGSQTNSVRRQLVDHSRKINSEISPVNTSLKIKNEIRVREDKPPLVSQQCVVYSFKCDLWDVGYLGYTCRQLH